jgi:hypothetical protein
VAIMGGNDVKLGDEAMPAGGPVIRTRLVSIMGGVGVERGRKLTEEERKRQKELRRAERGLLIQDQLVDAKGEEQREQAPRDRPAERPEEGHVEVAEAEHVHEDAGQHDRVDDDRGQR